MFPAPNEFSRNPVGWVRKNTGEFLWSKQRRIARSVVRNRYTAVPSCHDSGKSFIASRLVAWWIDVHPPGEAFAVTTAPTAHQVEAILWREIGRCHRKGDLPGRITLDAKWRLGAAHGDELVAYGRKPADYDPDAFQGIHQRYVLVVIDEANGVPKTMFDAVDTIVTNENARVLAIGNPDSPDSHFYGICQPDSGWNVIHIDGLKTPNFTGEPIPEELRELLLSPAWVEERRSRWGIGSPMWEAKVRGRFPKVAEDVLVQLDWWEKAAKHDIPKDPEFMEQRGYDIARFGTDSTMCYSYRGGRLRREWFVNKQDTVQIAQKVMRDVAKDPHLTAVVDETGVGAGVLDQLRHNNVDVYGFISGAMPTDDRFHNLRSEAFWHLRELFEMGLIDVDDEDEEFKSQITSLKWRVTPGGKIIVEPKEEYKKRLKATSPDSADGAMLAAWEPIQFNMALLAQHTQVDTITGDLMGTIW